MCDIKKDSLEIFLDEYEWRGLNATNNNLILYVLMKKI